MVIIETLGAGILFISFILGVKHSLDVDHVIAVSSILIRSPNFSRTVKLSIIWAIGHTITAGFITIIIFFFKSFFLQKIFTHFNVIVASMLIFMGIFSLLYELKLSRKKKNTFFESPAENKIEIVENTTILHKSLSRKSKIGFKLNPSKFEWLKNDSNAIISIGVIQGLASNDELFLLLVFTLGLNDFLLLLLGIIFFSIGVMTGMISWSSLINITSAKTRKRRLIRYINILIALIALAYGLYILFGGVSINLIPSS
ncbi:hypothetical protein LCGC14_0474980 [marine sediment metagenome]|uniref:Nickel/cobalt efflux system n=1 Tax=marine sediment metagenome TaxID=412755 RepID=A0A0F9SGD5_9ZZZZ